MTTFSRWRTLLCGAGLAAFAVPTHSASVAVTFGTSKPEVTVGSTVQINEQLAISPGYSKVFLQRGAASDQIRYKYEPYCYLALKRPRSEMDSQGVVQPDMLTVEKVYRRKDPIASRTPSFMVAEISTTRPTATHSRPPTWLTKYEGGPVHQNLYMKVSSGNNPTLTSFVCGVWAEPLDRGIPNLEEIKDAVGSLVSIELSQ